MNHIGTIELSTEHLTLRRYEIEDADAAFYNWAGSAETAHFGSWTPCENADETLELLESWIAGYGKPDYYLWAVEVNETEQPVGAIRVKSYDDDAMSAEFECFIGADFARKGVGLEAMTEVIRFLTCEVGAKRIWGKCDVNNDGGAKLMLRLGMEYEGTLKKAAKYNSGIVDATVFGTVFYSEEEMAADTEETPAGTSSTKVMGEDGVLRNQISDETMEYVGILAKLELSPAEMEAARRDMEEMLDYIDQLNELDTAGIEPMSHVFAVTNAFREDVITNGDGDVNTLSNAPMQKSGGFKVPMTIGE